MTEEERELTTQHLEIIIAMCRDKAVQDGLRAYRAEHERMRQFIRNLADESKVYLESEG